MTIPDVVHVVFIAYPFWGESQFVRYAANSNVYEILQVILVHSAVWLPNLHSIGLFT